MPAEVAAVVLAAGRATRFGADAATSKVYALFDGRPLVAHAVAAARASRARPIIVVTGQAADLAAEALRRDPADAIVHNPGYAGGMATSLRAGIAAVPADRAGAFVLLADMPMVVAATLDAMIALFAAEPCDAVIPTFKGRRGNPVLLGRSLFAAVAGLGGDEGARGLLRAPERLVLECPVCDPGILADVDTPEALAALRRR